MTQADDTKIQGEAIAGLALALSLLTFLRATKIMNADQQAALLDGVLTSLETKFSNHPAVQHARRIIETIGNTDAHAEKRDGKLTGFWYGEVDLRHKGGERFRRLKAFTRRARVRPEPALFSSFLKSGRAGRCL